MMNMKKCYLCGKSVLTLDGQYTRLKSTHLVHSSCMVDIEYAELLVDDQIADYLAEEQMNLLGVTENYTIFQDLDEKQLILIRKDGYKLTVAQSSLLLAKQGNKGLWVEKQEKLHISLPESKTSSLEEIQRSLQDLERYPLWDLLEEFELTEQLLHPEELHQAQLVYEPSMTSQWNAQTLAASVIYHVQLPAECLAIVGTVLNNQQEKTVSFSAITA